MALSVVLAATAVPGASLAASSGQAPPPLGGDQQAPSGMAEAAIFRPSTALWYGPFNGALGVFQIYLGQTGDVPIPGYYDNNPVVDPAVYQPSTGLWFSALSGGGVRRVDGLGVPTDVAVQKRPTLAGGG